MDQESPISNQQEVNSTHNTEEKVLIQPEEMEKILEELRRLRAEAIERRQEKERRKQDKERRRKQEEEKKLKEEEDTQILHQKLLALQGLYASLAPSVSFEKYYMNHIVPKIKICKIEEWFATADATNFNTKLDLSLSEELLQQAFEQMLHEVHDQLPYQILDTSQTRYIPGLLNRSPNLSFLPRGVIFQNAVLAKFVNVIGELKKIDEDIESHDNLGQICCYLERISKQNGGRSVYGFITNFQSAIFLQARAGDVLMRTQQFNFVEHQQNTTALYYFQSLLSKAAKNLPIELNGFTILKCIGEGLTSFVFQVEDANKSNKVLKLRKETATGWPFKVEAEVLSKIHHKTECKNNSNFIENVSTVEITDHNSFLIFSTQYLPLTKDHLTKTNVSQFLNFLQFIHTETIFHRDIRPNNLSYDVAHKSIVLLDFGYAITSNEDQFAGTLTYAATELLQTIVSNFSMFMCDFRYESKYDVESFVKSFYYLFKQPIQIVNLDRKVATDEFDLMKKLEEVITAWSDVEKSDDKFCRLMSSIRQDESLSSQQLCDNLFELL